MQESLDYMPPETSQTVDVAAELQAHAEAVEAWFTEQWKAVAPPAYASVDVRHAGYKMAAVDTNFFPAGYNNLSEKALARAAEAWSAWRQHRGLPTRLALIPENHTRNAFYRRHLSALISVLSRAGFELLLALVDAADDDVAAFQELESPGLSVGHLVETEDGFEVAGVRAEAFLLNNDFSAGVPEIVRRLPADRVFPNPDLSWAARLKSDHFGHLQAVTERFARVHRLDAWHLGALFDVCNEVNFVRRAGEACIVDRVQWLLNRIRNEQARHGVEGDPFVAVKADAGTYGMGVLMVKEAEEVLQLNRKSRVKMAKTKGAKEIERVIIQEGVPTREANAAGEPLEVVVYMVGAAIAGGFFRVHGGKTATDNLNAPGMTFVPVEDGGAFEPGGRLYAHGVIARLALLAGAYEQVAVESRA